MSTEKRTIGETAQLLGVSIRTLHYWEERGITHPSRESWSGYRLYSEADITRLQQALVYRATGMDLDTIVELLNSNDDPVAHFQRQRDKLIDKEHELRAMIEALDHLLEDAMTDKNYQLTISQTFSEMRISQLTTPKRKKNGAILTTGQLLSAPAPR